MSSDRPASEIEPVLSIASSSRILPGPSARSEPKSTRTVSLIPPIGHLAQAVTDRLAPNGHFAEASWTISSHGNAGRRDGLDRHRGECRQQAGQARCAQRQVAFAELAADPLERRRRVVADAIDGKHRKIGTAHEARKQAGIVLEPSVVVQEAAVDALDQGFELRRLAGAAADIENAQAAQIVRAG